MMAENDARAEAVEALAAEALGTRAERAVDARKALLAVTNPNPISDDWRGPRQRDVEKAVEELCEAERSVGAAQAVLAAQGDPA